MDTSLYKELVKLDPGIASAYKKAMEKPGPDNKITPRGVDLIFAKVIDSEHGSASKTATITDMECKALFRLIVAASFTTDALAHLKKKLQQQASIDALGAGAKRLTKKPELADVASALGNATVNPLSFTNPHTGCIYLPTHYRAIAQMILDKSIRTYLIQTHGLHRFSSLGGFYSSENQLFLVAGQDPRHRKLTIIHEATHAIQDWRDLRLQRKHAEADAYIAEGVVAHDLDWEGRSYQQTHADPSAVAFGNAAKIVRDGKANSSNSTWKPAYDQVLDAVSKSSGYKHNKDDYLDFKIHGEDKEAEQFQDLLDALNAKKK